MCESPDRSSIVPRNEKTHERVQQIRDIMRISKTVADQRHKAELMEGPKLPDTRYPYPGPEKKY